MPYVLDLTKNKTPTEQNANTASQNEPVASLSWQAPEYVYIKKSPDWYWAVGIMSIGFFVVAVIFQNFLFGAFMLLGGFTVALYGARPPRIVTFTLSVEGIRIENRVYPYESLKSFWIFYRPPDIKELSIESQKMIMPQIKIPLGEANPAEVRAYLQQFMPERQQEESLIDTAMRFLKF